ncbi:hypothetical protein EWI61_06375 [Methylolobus aquaticus]|nr:hypothetical protein EWI61_06375 [Methylolobus aquaticus]
MSQFTLTTLHLLRDELTSLSRTPFFSPSLESYLRNLIQILGQVIAVYDTLPAQTSRSIAQHIWRATKYLKGGTSKTVPYETVYALNLALQDWTTHPSQITTALSEDPDDYHFWSIDPGKVIRQFLPGVSFNVELIQIALPRLYRHRPLYNVALYHELGHYVDTHYQISKYSLILSPLPSGTPDHLVQVALSHRREFFADLFAASYTGKAIHKFLAAIAGECRSTATHPATNDRLQVVDDFVDGRANRVVEFFRQILKERDLPSLEIRYTRPDVSGCFNGIRPYRIANDAELHGILEAGWLFGEHALRRNSFPWLHMESEDVSRIVNDLVEKSIRNRMTVLKWQYANT